jgi:NTE family protein
LEYNNKTLSQQTDLKQMTKFGIVLSGGGMRGIAHLGVLKALAEYGIVPSMLSGTSAGATCGAFYSIGYSPDKIISLFREIKLFDIRRLLIGKAGLFSLSDLEKFFLEHFPENSLEALPIPLTVTATDIVNGQTVYFSSGNLSKAILASSCIPVLFEPVAYQDTLLVDGGVLNNFPVEPLIERCDKIIGIHVNAMSANKEHLSMRNIIDRSFHFALINAVHQKINMCDLFIEPPEMSRFGMFDSENGAEIFDFGYQFTKTLENKIFELLEATVVA